MTCYMSSGTLNSTHSFTATFPVLVCLYFVIVSLILVHKLMRICNVTLLLHGQQCNLGDLVMQRKCCRYSFMW